MCYIIDQKREILFLFLDYVNLITSSYTHRLCKESFRRLV